MCCYNIDNAIGINPADASDIFQVTVMTSDRFKGVLYYNICFLEPLLYIAGPYLVGLHHIRPVLELLRVPFEADRHWRVHTITVQFRMYYTRRVLRMGFIKSQYRGQFFIVDLYQTYCLVGSLEGLGGNGGYRVIHFANDAIAG